MTIKKCPHCGANHFFVRSTKNYEAEVDEKGNLSLFPEQEEIERVNCSNCGKQFDAYQDFEGIIGW
jgi:transcription elongation factor Elf1